MFRSSTKLLAFILVALSLLNCGQRGETVSGSSLPSTPTSETANIAEENFRKEWAATRDEVSAALNRNRDLWNAGEIVNYSFEAAKYAGGNTNSWNRLPARITVRENRPVSVEPIQKPTMGTDGFEEFDTIDKLFDYIQQELEKGLIHNVQYHAELGYPEHVNIKFSFENHGNRNIVISKLSKEK